MHAARSAILVLSGAFAGVVTVLSCGSNNPQGADAATCDCAPAEPPLDGRIIYVQQTGTIGVGESNGLGVACPEGAVLLGGSCLADNQGAPEITLQQAGQQINLGSSTPSNFWICNWHNGDTQPAAVRAEVTCLTPAQ